MPQARLFKQTSYAEVRGKRPVGRPRTRWLDYIEGLGWNRLGRHPSELLSMLVDREVWWLNLELLHQNPLGKTGEEKKRSRIYLRSDKKV